MLDRLPKYIEPLSLADKRRVLKGRIPLICFNRLAEFLADNSGSVAIDLSFGRVDNLAVIEGGIETTLELVCQNCLQAVAWPIDHAVALGVVRSIAEAERLPGNYEPLLLEDEKILLADIVEDELLLIVPQYPKHQNHCLEQVSNLSGSGSMTVQKQTHRENPFSILTNLNTSETHHGSTKK